MPTLFWDASSYSKRYTVEQGRDTVDALLASPLVRGMAITLTGYGKTHAILRRRFNDGSVGPVNYARARAALRLEVIESLSFQLLEAEKQVFASIPLIERHNLNATDAAILAAFLDYRASLPPAELPAVLIASDHRLLRAAQAEGLPVLDPEAVAAADVSAILASL